MKRLKLLLPAIAMIFSLLFIQACGKKVETGGANGVATAAAVYQPYPYTGTGSGVTAGQYLISTTSGPSYTYYYIGTGSFQWLSYPNPAYVRPGDTLIIVNNKDAITAAINGAGFGVGGGQTYKALVNAEGYLAIGVQINSTVKVQVSEIRVMRCQNADGSTYVCP